MKTNATVKILLKIESVILHSLVVESLIVSLFTQCGIYPYLLRLGDEITTRFALANELQFLL